MTQDEEKIARLSQELHAASVRIGKLEASNVALGRDRAALAAKVAMYEGENMRRPKLDHERIDCEAWRDWAQRLTGFAKGSTDGGYRSGVASRIAELREQLDAKHAKLVEVADKLAAARPVLTAEEYVAAANCARVYHRESDPGLAGQALLRLCQPPKAPPTDAEFYQILDEVTGESASDRSLLYAVKDALRARGAK